MAESARAADVNLQPRKFSPRGLQRLAICRPWLIIERQTFIFRIWVLTMLRRTYWTGLFVAAGVLLATPMAEAAAVRFHYVPGDADSCGTTAMKPACEGESMRWFGTFRESCNDHLRPTHIVTFCHAYTGHNVSVPLALPEGTPIMMHGPDRVTFNYGSYAVRVRFLPDGSVDVIYDSGFLRAP
jgi:hypothetical protein